MIEVIKWSDTHGSQTILINPDCIAYVAPLYGMSGCLVKLTNGKELKVLEPLEYFREVLG
jgi:hypothetical protein